MPETWRELPTQDKLNIFVSSRLGECKDERKVASKAISDINHSPVLFEHLGARSYRSRDLYLSRLRASQIMVAIYRDGYGYIDEQGGMEISGVEDEFRAAQAQGIPLLVYALRERENRDPRLEAIVREAENAVVLSYYSVPDELYERIKNDVTAEITRSVLRPDITRDALKETSSVLLARAEKRQGALLPRPEVINSLRTLIESEDAVGIYGSAGIGKTTLAAQVADEIGGKYLRVTDLAPRDLFTACASALAKDGLEQTFSTLAGAQLGFSAAWAEAKSFVLIVDECDFIGELQRAIQLAGGTSNGRKLVVTSRSPIVSMASFEVPELTHAEAEALAGKSLTALDPKMAVTPLAAQDLRREATRQPSAQASEIVAYLAISPRPLDADDLLNLLGLENVGALYSDMATLSRLVDDTPTGFRLIHAEIGETQKTELRSTPQRLRFYVNRLLPLFEHDARSAYQIALLLDDGSEDQFAYAAIRESAQLGDWRLGRQVAERLLNEALNEERRADAFHLMLTLTHPMELMGEAAQAAELLDRAREIAPSLGDDAVRQVNELTLGASARKTLSAQDVAALEELRDRYRSEDAMWDHARVGLELSALYIASKLYEKAVDVLRDAISHFEEVGDEYGLDLSERNLASALSALDGTDAEVDELLRRISDRSSSSTDQRRQRAWYCNVLTRKYRTAKRYDEAISVAREAIDLSKSLGDESLRALNLINLGNVYKDIREAKLALDTYSEAGNVAQTCGRRDIEADASRLRAGVLNDLPESEEFASNRHEQAKLFAEHALGLLSGTIYFEALARSHIELADSEEELGHEALAARSYFKAADEFRKVPDDVAFEHALIRATENAIEADTNLYIEELNSLFGADLDLEQSLGRQFIGLIGPLIASVPRKYFVRILGRHLQMVRDNLPPLLRPVLLEQTIEALSGPRVKSAASGAAWRQLFPALIVPFLSRDNKKSYLQRRLARSLSDNIEGLDFRDYRDGQVWTVVLNLARPCTITIMAIDESFDGLIAAQSLAVFLKAFESEISEIVGNARAIELDIQVARYDEMPDDLRAMSEQMFSLSETLEEQHAAATRTDDFSGDTPTMVFLHPEFLDRVVAGTGAAGSLQYLFAMTLSEILHQCFEGQVDLDQIRPKMMRLVKDTIS